MPRISKIDRLFNETLRELHDKAAKLREQAAALDAEAERVERAATALLAPMPGEPQPSRAPYALSEPYPSRAPKSRSEP